MNRHRHEDLPGLRIGMLSVPSDKEVFGAPFYPPALAPPDRNPADPVRSGRRLALRRPAHRPAPRSRAARGTGALARGHLDAGADLVGLPEPGHQPRRLVPLDGGPRPGLA